MNLIKEKQNGALIAYAALLSIFLDRNKFFEWREFLFWLSIHEKWVLCSDGGRISHSSWFCTFRTLFLLHNLPVLGADTFAFQYGLWPAHLCQDNGWVAMVVLVDKNIIARMASNDLTLHRSDYKQHKYISLNQINVSLTHFSLARS